MRTVTPRKIGFINRSKAEPASKQTDVNPVGGSGSKQFRLDKRLETARLVLESQPSNMIVPISEASLAMHSTSVEIRLKKNGVSKLETNDELFPKSINFKPKFDAPEDLRNSDATKKDAAEFDKLIRDTMVKAKALIIKQGNRTVRHMEEGRRNLFIKNTLTLAGHYATYHRMLHIVPVDTRGLSDANIGGIGLYCYINGLDTDSTLFEYLFEEKEFFVPPFKNKAINSATGIAIFGDKALNEITCDLKIGETLTSAQINLLPQYDEATTTQLSDLQEPLLGQATATMETEFSQEENPFDTPSNRRLIVATAHSLRDIIIPVFCETEGEMARVQQAKVANAKLAAVIKQSTSLDIAKEVQQALDEETSVQPQNMEAVVAAHALKIWKEQEKTLFKELRKNTLGGARGTATNPNVQSNGDGSRKQQHKQVKKGKQLSWKPSLDKQAKKKFEGTSLKRKHNENPYPTNKPSGHSPHQQGRGGRGRGRGRGRSPGRGRGGRGRGRGRGI